MSTVKICNGYCPVMNLEYFINVKYKLSGINIYSKHSYECCHTAFYHQKCPEFPNCPIFLKAPDTIKNW